MCMIDIFKCTQEKHMNDNLRPPCQYKVTGDYRCNREVAQIGDEFCPLHTPNPYDPPEIRRKLTETVDQLIELMKNPEVIAKLEQSAVKVDWKALFEAFKEIA
jgi:hypothetical protein